MRASLAHVALSVVALVVGGCGRRHFDERSDGSGADAASACPVDFVFVAGVPALGTQDFCVMRFEAKARSLADDTIDAVGCDAACAPNSFVTTHEPAGVAEGQPWRAVEVTQEQSRCQARGVGFDLMSNREWMTIARDAERVAENWSGCAPGSGRLIEGNTDGSLRYGSVSDLDDPYSDTGNSAADPPGAGWEQRRTVALSSGLVVWDLAGNVQEWIDWTLGGAVNGAPTPCSNAELPAFACAGIVPDDFDSSTGTYDSSNGTGTVIGGSGNATRRGGQSGDLTLAIAGIYALNMNRNMTDTFSGTGFRCVLRL